MSSTYLPAPTTPVSALAPRLLELTADSILAKTWYFFSIRPSQVDWSCASLSR